MALLRFPVSFQQWAKYSSASGFRNSDPVLKVIDGLVRAYLKREYRSAKLDILYQLQMSTEYWLKYANQLGRFRGKEARRPAITDMRDLCNHKLEKKLDKVRAALEDVFEEPEGHGELEDVREQRFLLKVKPGIQRVDRLAADRGMPYFTEESERRKFKLSFRRGIAHRWTYDEDDEKTEFVVYDTDKFNDRGVRKGENDVGIFVMGTNGRIYTGVDKSKYRGHVHSYFFAGAPVLCAGLMRVEQGRIVTISGSSGHYGPSAHHMLRLVTRLQLCQVRMSSLRIRRINENLADSVEECSAEDFVRHRGWPTGVQPRSMWVSKTGG